MYVKTLLIFAFIRVGKNPYKEQERFSKLTGRRQPITFCFDAGRAIFLAKLIDGFTDKENVN